MKVFFDCLLIILRSDSQTNVLYFVMFDVTIIDNKMFFYATSLFWRGKINFKRLTTVLCFRPGDPDPRGTRLPGEEVQDERHLEEPG